MRWTQMDVHLHPPVSTCIHLKTLFGGRFRLENHDFDGPGQSVDVVVVHVVVNCPPTAYQVRL